MIRWDGTGSIDFGRLFMEYGVIAAVTAGVVVWLKGGPTIGTQAGGAAKGDNKGHAPKQMAGDNKDSGGIKVRKQTDRQPGDVMTTVATVGVWVALAAAAATLVWIALD